MSCVWSSSVDKCPPPEAIAALAEKLVDSKARGFVASLEYQKLKGGRPPVVRWGMKSPVCEYHYWQARRIIDGGLDRVVRLKANGQANRPGDWEIVKFKKGDSWIAEGYPHFSATEVDDFAKLACLVRDKVVIAEYIQKLDTELGQGNEALASILEKYEQKCWFPNTRVIPTGVLPGNEFIALIGKAWIGMKDIGAGLAHGEWAHRLQWHAILRAVTKDFTQGNPAASGFYHSPLYLYSRLGQADSFKSVGLKLTHQGKLGVSTLEQSSLWGYLFDLAGAQGWYNAPDQVTEDLLKGVFGNHVKAVAEARHNKRKLGEDTIAQEDIIAYLQDRPKLNPLSAVREIAADRYGQTKVAKGIGHDDVGYSIWKQGTGWKVLVDKTRPALDDNELKQRISKSATGFCTDAFQPWRSKAQLASAS